MWGSCLAEDVRDGKKKDGRVSRECYEDCMGAEWGTMLRSKECQVLQVARGCVQVSSDLWQCFARVGLRSGARTETVYYVPRRSLTQEETIGGRSYEKHERKWPQEI